MRYPRIAGLCLASMLAVGMALAGSASAAPLWLVCLEGTGLTKYLTSMCTEASGAGGGSKGWQSLGVPAGREITIKLLVISLLLIDTKSNLGEVKVNCDDPGGSIEGVIKANGEAEIRKFEYSAPVDEHCVDENHNCPKVVAVKGLSLPWLINLEERPKPEILAKIAPHAGGGRPGWEVVCEPLPNVHVEDKCTSLEKEEEELKLVNTISERGKLNELLVTALLQSNHSLKCSQSGTATGSLKGSLAILLPGGALSVNRV